MPVCKCVPGLRRCDFHAFEYAIRTMETRGWRIIDGNKDMTAEEAAHRLETLGVDVMEWHGREMGDRSKWGPDCAVLIAQTNLPWEIRRSFITYVRRQRPRTDEFIAAIRSAERLGGQEAVDDVVQDFASEVGTLMLRGMGLE